MCTVMAVNVYNVTYMGPKCRSFAFHNLGSTVSEVKMECHRVKLRSYKSCY